MRKSKIIDINVIFAAIFAVLLIAFTCFVPVSANTRDGVVSDDGIPNGDMSDGVISDTPDSDMIQNGHNNVDNSMNNGPSDTGNSVIGDVGNAIGEAGKDVANGAGNAVSDIAGGMNDMANGTMEAGSGMGNLVGTVVWIVIAAAVIALIVYFVCRKTPDKK